MKIIDVLSKATKLNYKKYQGDIGLEIETESKEEYIVPKFSFWAVHVDNSLRDFGQEYVLKQPLNMKNFKEALKEFADKTEKINFIKDSITTSVHVHINFLNENFQTLGNFLTAYALLENLLVRYSGEDRKSNLFCLPMIDAEEIVENIIRMFKGIQKRNYAAMVIGPEHSKYGALNLSSLASYGSLEIRSFRGTTDIVLIETWVGLLYNILEFARNPKLVPPSIIIDYKNNGVKLVPNIIGDSYAALIDHPDKEKLIDKNFYHAARIAYSVKDWIKVNELEEPKKTKPRDFDEIARRMYGTIFDELEVERQQRVTDWVGTGVGDDPTHNVAAIGAFTHATNNTTRPVTAWETFRVRTPQPTPITRTFVTERQYDNLVDNYMTDNHVDEDTAIEIINRDYQIVYDDPPQEL